MTKKNISDLLREEQGKNQDPVVAETVPTRKRPATKADLELLVVELKLQLTQAEQRIEDLEKDNPLKAELDRAHQDALLLAQANTQLREELTRLKSALASPPPVEVVIPSPAPAPLKAAVVETVLRAAPLPPRPTFPNHKNSDDQVWLL